MRLPSDKPLLMLDLDESVIFYDWSGASVCPKVGEFEGVQIVARPGLSEFLKVVEQHFQVAVWTAACMEYANIIVANAIQSDLTEPLSFVWARERCTMKRMEDSGFEWVWTKPLVKVKRSFSFPFSQNVDCRR